MKRFLTAGLACTLVALLAVPALADFTPKFTVSLSDTKVKGNPDLNFLLEFDAEDEEINLFTGYIPKGFNIASDEDVPDGEEIGSGEIMIRAGFDCRPGPEGAIPVGAEITVPATFEEQARTDDEIDQGVHAVWFLNLEPLNRVRLLVKGSPKTGWTVEGAPTPSDNTCNPLRADLTINAQSESGVPIVTNPAKGGKKLFMADISSQDSPTVAHFEQIIKITK